MQSAGITGARGCTACRLCLGQVAASGGSAPAVPRRCYAAARSESPSPRRAWPGIHRLPSGCGHAALLPALGMLLLPDGCFAGTGQPGKGAGAGRLPARRKPPSLRDRLELG